MKKNIKFLYDNEFGPYYSDIINSPKSAKTYIPEWYKNIPNTIGESKKRGLSPENKFATNSTIKGCAPFLDGLSLGYIYELPIDVEFRKEGDNVIANWRSNEPFITTHSIEQHDGMPPANKHMNFVLKWNFPFSIETPEGYSCFFTHPINRHDLPFRTFSGVVETDMYKGNVQFPFQLIHDFEYNLIIEKGTPICQIIPFKRDEWKSEKSTISVKEKNIRMFNIHSKIINSYKSQWWRKKSFE
jgi:hypothetical protein